MGYRVLIGTVQIECDTPEEAFEMAKRVAGIEGGPHAKANSAPERLDNGGSRWTESRIRDFFKLIKGSQRKVVDALLENMDGRTDEQLLQLLGVCSGLTGLDRKEAVGAQRGVMTTRTRASGRS